jgi:predicted Fe-S protein YdhL (DUF1289 family)
LSETSELVEAAVYDFCFGDGRAIPPSVFLGRVVAPGEPQWTDEDKLAALEWHARQKMLCPGCGRPRDESFDPSMEDHYEVTVLRCHSCSYRDTMAYNRAQNGGHPSFGDYFVVQPEGRTDADVGGT